MNGLPVDRLIALSYSIASSGAQFANVNSACIIGPSGIVAPGTVEEFEGIGAVAAAFGDSAPEYLAAIDYFDQNPSPQSIFLGGWAQVASPSQLIGAPVAENVQGALLTTLQAITTASLAVTIDGTACTAAGVNLSGAETLNQVASLLTAALTPADGTIEWNGSNFVVVSSATGSASSITFPTTPGSGTNVATDLQLTAATGAFIIQGINAQSPLQAVQAIDAGSTYVYGLMFAPNPESPITDVQYEAVAAFIEADALNPHVFGITTQESAALETGNTSSLPYVLKGLGYQRTFVIFCSTDPNAVAGVYALLVNVNWQGSNTSINYMFQSLVGIEPENLTSAQADALDACRCNYFAEYANGVPILETGFMCGPAYLDEITGADALANEIQTNVFNVLVGVGTKVAQTDAGQDMLKNGAVQGLETFVTNDFLAPGTWTAGGFGQLSEGDYMLTGYYVYQPPVASQSPTDRAARKSVNFQIAAKLAGATNTANLQLTFNR